MDEGGAPFPAAAGVGPPSPPGPGDLRFPARTVWGDPFYWGTQTAATQVEGGGIDNSFTAWAKDSAHIADGSEPNPGLDHWNLYEEDYEHLRQNGHNAHGFTIDWARVEPVDGEPFDQAAIAHYLDEIETCHRKGIEPIITVLHYALPNWLAERGGVLSKDAPERFERFVTECARQFGDKVRWWNTLNEPTVLAGMGYFLGTWPPGEKSPFKLFKALDAVLQLHAAGTRAIRNVAAEQGRSGQVKVSIAHALRPARAYQSWNPADQFVARIFDYAMNRWFLDSCQQGKSIWPIGSGKTIPGLKGSLDYIGLNYYTRDQMHFTLKGGRESDLVDLKLDPKMAHTLYDWNVDPDGLFESTLRIWNQFHLPIMICENGVSDSNDELRPRYIVDHLAAFQHCHQLGIPVLGYLHWTDWDNWEWAEGWRQKFGIFSFDPVTGERGDKPSAAVFGEICKRNAIPESWLTRNNIESPATRDRHSATELRRTHGPAHPLRPVFGRAHGFHLAGG